jgi:hypothetical protein
MSKAGYSFGKLPTLSTVIWSAEKVKSWKWGDNRHLESIMQRFVVLNQKNLSYLGITASVIEREGRPAIQLCTSKYIGAIPIITPATGKPCGDLIVTGRFGENAGELITFLDDSIRPEYSGEFMLTQDSQMTPPIFIECCKYLGAYIEADRFKWRKFNNVVKVESKPSGSTLWGEYAQRVAKNPLDVGRFKNKSNILSTNHTEWNQLNYVLSLAINELESTRVPIRTRVAYSDRISQLKRKLQSVTSEYTTVVREHMSDPVVIKRLKQLANQILQNKSHEKLAWRMDYAEFFERYVQYIMEQVAKKKGVRSINNPHYGISVNRRPAWGLSYLEPDVVLHHDAKQIVIDAKYKSHLFNWEDQSDELKDTFRHDLHQILAYCSFSTGDNKEALIVYPYTDFTIRRMRVSNPLTHIENIVCLVGIPIDRNKIHEVEDEFSKIIKF